MDFAVLTNHIGEMEESETIDKYLEFVRQLRSVKLMLKPIAVSESKKSLKSWKREWEN